MLLLIQLPNYYIPMHYKTYFKLIFSILICLSIGYIGSFFTGESITTWYASLQKPSYNPPSWIFGVVWTILYILMGISAFLVWKQGIDKRPVKIVLIFFLLQLFLNGLWTPIFFKYHLIGIAFIEIIILWIFVIITIFKLWRISKASAILLLPYLMWLSFAIILNGSFWYLNK